MPVGGGGVGQWCVGVGAVAQGPAGRVWGISNNLQRGGGEAGEGTARSRGGALGMLGRPPHCLVCGEQGNGEGGEFQEEGRCVCSKGGVNGVHQTCGVGQCLACGRAGQGVMARGTMGTG